MHLAAVALGTWIFNVVMLLPLLEEESIFGLINITTLGYLLPRWYFLESVFLKDIE